jgi:hypothetical protein
MPPSVLTRAPLPLPLPLDSLQKEWPEAFIDTLDSINAGGEVPVPRPHPKFTLQDLQRISAQVRACPGAVAEGGAARPAGAGRQPPSGCGCTRRRGATSRAAPGAAARARLRLPCPPPAGACL